MGVDLISGFSCQFGEDKQRQIIRSFIGGQHLGAQTLYLRYLGFVQLFSLR